MTDPGPRRSPGAIFSANSRSMRSRSSDHRRASSSHPARSDGEAAASSRRMRFLASRRSPLLASRRQEIPRAASQAEISARETSRNGRTRPSPRRSRGPASDEGPPRRSRAIRKVSSRSSAWWAVAIEPAPASAAISFKAAYRSSRAPASGETRRSRAVRRAFPARNRKGTRGGAPIRGRTRGPGPPPARASHGGRGRPRRSIRNPARVPSRHGEGRSSRVPRRSRGGSARRGEEGRLPPLSRGQPRADPWGDGKPGGGGDRIRGLDGRLIVR